MMEDGSCEMVALCRIPRDHSFNGFGNVSLQDDAEDATHIACNDGIVLLFEAMGFGAAHQRQHTETTAHFLSNHSCNSCCVW